MTPLSMTLIGAGREVASLATATLSNANLRVVQSFDLACARADHIDCSCPYHGSESCDCQMIVLLVYGGVGPPVTLTIHGRDGFAQVALVEDAAKNPSPELRTLIFAALVAAFQSHPRLEVVS